MVAGESIETVCASARILEPAEGPRYMPDNEAIKFLASRFLCYGLRIKPPLRMDGDTTNFNVEIDLRDAPAILAVKSENFAGFQHAVVWCNQRRKVLDPLYDEPQPIERYKILEWVPISHV